MLTISPWHLLEDFDWLKQVPLFQPATSDPSSKMCLPAEHPVGVQPSLSSASPVSSIHQSYPPLPAWPSAPAWGPSAKSKSAPAVQPEELPPKQEATPAPNPVSTCWADEEEDEDQEPEVSNPMPTGPMTMADRLRCASLLSVHWQKVTVVNWGERCTVRVLSKWAILDPVSPMAKVTEVTTVFADTGLPQIPT